jgi:hypothetical protein
MPEKKPKAVVDHDDDDDNDTQPAEGEGGAGTSTKSGEQKRRYEPSLWEMEMEKKHRTEKAKRKEEKRKQQEATATAAAATSTVASNATNTDATASTSTPSTSNTTTASEAASMATSSVREPVRRVEIPRSKEQAGQFVQVLMNIIAIEMRVQLMAHSAVFTSAHNAPKPSPSSATVIASCFRLIESCMNYLVNDDMTSNNSSSNSSKWSSYQWSRLPGEVLLRMKTRFDDIYNEILQYVRDAMEHDRNRDTLVVACVRSIGTWLAEDGQSLQGISFFLPSLCTSPITC